MSAPTLDQLRSDSGPIATGSASRHQGYWCELLAAGHGFSRHHAIEVDDGGVRYSSLGLLALVMESEHNVTARQINRASRTDPDTRMLGPGVPRALPFDIQLDTKDANVSVDRFGVVASIVGLNAHGVGHMDIRELVLRNPGAVFENFATPAILHLSEGNAITRHLPDGCWRTPDKAHSVLPWEEPVLEEGQLWWFEDSMWVVMARGFDQAGVEVGVLSYNRIGWSDVRVVTIEDLHTLHRPYDASVDPSIDRLNEIAEELQAQNPQPVVRASRHPVDADTPAASGYRPFAAPLPKQRATST